MPDRPRLREPRRLRLPVRRSERPDVRAARRHALASLEDLDERLEERNRLAAAYTAALAGIPGIRVPEVPLGDRSTYKDYTVLVDPDGYGLDADALGRGPAAGRDRDPPLLLAARPRDAGLSVPGQPAGPLPVTEWAAERALTLPLWVGMTDAQVTGVAEAIRRIRPEGGRAAYGPRGQERYGGRPVAHPRRTP